MIDSATLPAAPAPQVAGDTSASALVRELAARWRWLCGLPVAAAILAFAATYLIAPTFTARTSFLPPQQQQGVASAALATLGALAGAAGGQSALRTPADQYLVLLQSTTLRDRVIDQFQLMTVYDRKYRVDARTDLGNNVRLALGRRDGIISIEVDDEDPARAAAIANAHVTELRRLTSSLALTEAQQRRAFFEGQLARTREQLVAAQQALARSGFDAGALKAEPRAAADSYGRLRAEVTAAEVRLQALRGSLVDGAPEITQQQAALSALRQQLERAEKAGGQGSNGEYVARYREFKYQEALFELFARQYELARVDEAREGALIQVIDTAEPPEKKSRPKRVLTAAVAFGVAFLLTLGGLVVRHAWRRVKGPTPVPR